MNIVFLSNTEVCIFKLLNCIINTLNNAIICNPPVSLLINNAGGVVLRRPQNEIEVYFLHTELAELFTHLKRNTTSQYIHLLLLAQNYIFL